MNRIRIGLCVCALLIVAQLAAADSATLSLSVANTAPTVDNLVVGEQDSSIVLTPYPGVARTYNVSAEVSDPNGYQDIDSVTCTRAGSAGTDSFTLNFAGMVDTDTAQFMGAFQLESYDTAGMNNMTCIATSNAAQGTRTETFEYEELVALDLDANTLSFGTVQPGVFNDLAGDEDMLTADAPTIQNIGNTRIDAQVSGTDFVSAQNETITVDNLEFRFGSLSYVTASTVPQTETALDLIQGENQLENLDLRLYVPSGTQSANFDGQITVTAVAG